MLFDSLRSMKGVKSSFLFGHEVATYSKINSNVKNCEFLYCRKKEKHKCMLSNVCKYANKADSN